MGIVSYAQNFEDVILWRSLKHVDNGFYIDVGAAWPDKHSVTKAFYERGWNGINIDPNPEFNRQLQEHRPKDINLCLAIGEREEILTMNFIKDTGLSTIDDTIAEMHQKAGWCISRQQVQVTTLAEIWRQHVPAGQEVHFLKVDVEGFEEAALRGNNWKTNRPWVVMVEAMLPLSQDVSYPAWESILLDSRYQFAYVDGLNRFYVASEQADDLLPAFTYPPNVFDEFVLIDQQQAEASAQQAEARAQQAEARAQQAEARAQQAEARAQQAEARAQQAEARAQQAEARAQQAEEQVTNLSQTLCSIYASNGWRFTLLLRAVARFFRGKNDK